MTCRPRRTRLFGVALICIGIVLVLGGCQSILAKSPKSANSLRLGVSIFDGADPIQTATVRAIEARAQVTPVSLLPVADAQGVASAQVRGILRLGRRAQAMLIIPGRSEAIGAAIARVVKTGTKVVVVDEPSPVKVSAVVRPNEMSTAREACQAITSDAPPGGVLDVESRSRSAAAAELHAQLLNCFAASPTRQLVAVSAGADDAKTTAATLTALRSHRGVTAVVIESDAESAEAVLAALRSASRTAAAGQPAHLFTVAIDGSHPALAALASGRIDLVLAPQIALIAKAAIGRAYLAVLHRQPKKKTQLRDGHGDPELLIRGIPVRKAQARNPGLWGNRPGG